MQLAEEKSHKPLLNPTDPMQKSLEEHQQNALPQEMVNSLLKYVEVEALPKDMDLYGPLLITLLEEWHGKDKKDTLAHSVRILYNACFRGKEKKPIRLEFFIVVC